MNTSREFVCRVPASLAKDASLSPLARLLYVVLCAHADGKTGRAFLRLARLDELLGCSRKTRQRAQLELVRTGWMRMERKSCTGGRWGSRVFVINFFRPTTRGRFEPSGEKDPFFNDHSQVGQVIGNLAVPAVLHPSPQSLTKERSILSESVTRPT